MSDYYSVTQYSKITGKDPGNIRRMLISGKLTGEKIGRQWAIPKSADYPEDNRVKTGRYRKQTIGKLSKPALGKALNEMSLGLSRIYGDCLERIVLYGSYARGTQTMDSDVDIALILKRGSTELMHDRMVDLVVDYELAQAVTISVVPIDYEQYEKWSKTLPYYRNIDKEGIVLWKK